MADEDVLRSSQLVYVATQRRNGERSTSKPVWFATEGDRVFFTVSPTSWKAKRIAAGSPLFINFGSKDGPFFIGDAEPVRDSELIDRMGRVYAKKYWLAWMGFARPRAGRVAAGKTNAYLVTLRKAETKEA